jgi:hypothetical protein
MEEIEREMEERERDTYTQCHERAGEEWRGISTEGGGPPTASMGHPTASPS